MSIRRALRASVLVAVSLGYLAYVFDVFHHTFWTAGLGDWIDPYFINYLLEHWYHAVASFSDPWSPPFFYPAQKVLGYSHSLILYAPFYIAVRLFLHPFQAYSLSLLIMIETGIICLYVIFRRYMRLSFVESLLLATFFFTSQNVINGTIGVWSQRASVFLVPPILLLGLISYHRRPGRSRLVLAGLSGFLGALLFPHDFYSGFFTFLFAALFVAAWALVDGQLSAIRPTILWRAQPLAEKLALVATLLGAGWSTYLWVSGGVRMRLLGFRIASQDWRRPAVVTLLCVLVYGWLRGAERLAADLKAVASKARTIAAPWLQSLVIGGLIGSAVFLWIYLPAYREHPRFPEHDLLSQIRVRSWHRWDSPLTDLSAYDTVRSFTLVAIAAIFACLPGLRIDRQTRWYVLWAFLASALVFVMPLRIGGFAIWLSFLRHVPGFSVIRDPTRVIFQYELAFIIAAALLLTRLRSRPIYRMSACLLLLFFMITDHRADVLGYDRPVSVFHRWVESPIAIDPGCHSFFMKAASDEYMKRSENVWALYGGDAMFIALRHGIPTLNGYSAWGPDGWDLMNPPEPDYRDRVRGWIALNGLTGVCELDIDARSMRPATLH